MEGPYLKQTGGALRLVACDVDPAEVQVALGEIKASGASVLLNPAYTQLDPDAGIYIALGSPAVRAFQGAGYIPKKGGVEALRGRVFPWAHPDLGQYHFGVSYDPTVRFIDYSKFVDLQCDIGLYQRFEQTGSITPKVGNYAWVPDFSGVIAYIAAWLDLRDDPCPVAIDLETMGLHPWYPDKKIVSVSITCEEGIADAFYCLTASDEAVFKVRDQLQWIMAHKRVRVIGANLKFDLLWLRVKWGIVCENFAFDTCNAGALLEENRSNTLNVHTKVYSPELGGYDDEFNQLHDKSRMELVPPDDLLPYAGGDTDACLRNYWHIRKALLQDNPGPNGKPARNSLPSVYINVVHPALKALHAVEYHGVCVDKEKFHAFGSDLNGRMQETMQKAVKLLPRTILEAHGGVDTEGCAPLSKPKMIADFLFSPNGLNLQPKQTTAKTGAPSTSEFHLSQFKDHPDAGPLISLYLDYKSVSKMFGTYYKGFLQHLRPDDRWHATYIIHKSGQRRGDEQGGGTVTGRGSAVDPAFQCVTGETMIHTPQGERPIRDLVDPYLPNSDYNPMATPPPGMKIWAGGNWRDVSRLFKTWRHDIVRIELQSGRALKCTPEHPIITKRGWVQAKDLTCTDQLVLQSPADLAPALYPPGVAQALGVLAAVGSVSPIHDGVAVMLPLSFLLDFKQAEGGVLTYEEAILDDQAVLTWRLGELNDLDGVLLSHLHEGGFPADLRGREDAREFIRGVFDVSLEFKKSNLGKMVVDSIDRDFLDAIAEQLLLNGLVPPHLRDTATGYSLRWVGASARKTLEWLDRPVPEGWPHDYSHGGIIMPLQVRSVEPTGKPEYVYDLTVPDFHAFTANGWLVHNTVPKHSYWGQRLRECIVAPDGYRIAGIDYSQGELKVAACWAGEPMMIKAYKDGIDLHILTAATVNGMTYEEAMFLKKNDEAAYKVLRQNGKAGNFGLLYGMMAYGFMIYAEASYGVKLTLEEAEAMRDAFFDLYPGLPLWHDKQIMEARTTGMVRSPLGRVRRLYNINSPIKEARKRAENQAINSPIQGTLGDMMWMAMGMIEEQHGGRIIPFGNVHDQGLWYIREDTWEEDLKACKDIMENLPFAEKFGWKPELAFTVDAEVGSNLAGLEEVEFA